MCVCKDDSKSLAGWRGKATNEMHIKTRLNSEVRQGSQAGYKIFSFLSKGKVVTKTSEEREKSTKKERGTQPKWFSMQSWPLLVRSWSLTVQNSSSFYFIFIIPPVPPLSFFLEGFLIQFESPENILKSDRQFETLISNCRSFLNKKIDK